MSSQNKPGRRLLGVLVPAALLLWTFVATGTADSPFSALDGRYHSSGKVMLSDGRVLSISKSLVLDKGRFQSMIRNATVIAEAAGRLEIDPAGRIMLLVEERHVSELTAEDKMDDELMFNLLYGRHRGAQVTLERIGTCLYGIETRTVYCADDHSQREDR